MRTITMVIFLFCIVLMAQGVTADEYQGEHIVYFLSPLSGRAEYTDLGLTDLNGRKVRLTVFQTKVFGFKDVEKIYSDDITSLPIRVERDIKGWIGGENIIEEYDQTDFKVTITKLKGKKKVSKQVFSAAGPISNATLVPFYLRKVADMKIGWSYTFYLPQKYEAKLVSLDEIKAGGKKYSAYHFTSIPDKFEIWISDDAAHVPLRIRSKGGVDYTLLMKERDILPAP
jgi:hypothetical protein